MMEKKLGMPPGSTAYRWKRRSAGMGMPEVRWLKLLEEENRKQQQLVADLSLDKRLEGESQARIQTLSPGRSWDEAEETQATFQGVPAPGEASGHRVQ